MEQVTTRACRECGNPWSGRGFVCERCYYLRKRPRVLGRKCVGCQVLIDHMSAKAIFCSQACGQRHRAGRPPHPMPLHLRTCVQCGASIEHRSLKARTCSTACYQWTRKHPGEPRQLRVCIGCGDSIAELPPQAKACSRQCLHWASKYPGTLLPKDRRCEACGRSINHRPLRARVCSRPCQRWIFNNPGKQRKQSVSCQFCGKPLEGRRIDALVCDETCRVRLHADLHRDKSRRRRARVKGARSDELVRSVEVLDRDGWICQLCGTPIDKGAEWPDPMSKSIDHVIPVSRGGHHSMDNLQAAHLGCNSRKGVGNALARTGNPG